MALNALARTTLVTLLLLSFSRIPLYSQNPEYTEPIIGQIVRELPSLQPQETLDGSIDFYEILKLNIYEAQLYQAIELNLEATNANPEEEIPVSLVVYSGVKESSPSPQSPQSAEGTEEAETPSYLSGTRLLTKGLIKQNKAQIYLKLSGQTIGEELSPSNSLDLLLQQENFPLYIVLYPFQKPQVQGSEQRTRYNYSIRFIKKNYGFVRFRLLPAAQNQNQNQAYKPHSALSIQIDDQSYAWQDERQDERQAEKQSEAQSERQGQRQAENQDAENQNAVTSNQQSDQEDQSPEPLYSGYSDSPRLSQPYQIPIGEHSVQVSNLKYYARDQFQIEPGELATVDLQLRERLSQLVVIVPKGAAILLDGIPLEDREGEQRHTPIWQNVEMIELESFQHAVPRLKYNLTLPVGNHHLLLQYEDKTWQRQIYLEQGSEQVFQLSWQLSSRPSQ